MSTPSSAKPWKVSPWPTPTSSMSTTRPTSSPAAPPRPRARSASSPAADPGTSPCTRASSAKACWMRPCPARSSPRPTPDPILEATKAADRGAGVLHIVKNYTGDVLNFETAAELADMEDIQVATRRRQRRRRRRGLPLHGGAPRRRRYHLRGEDRGRGRRARRLPGGSHPASPPRSTTRPAPWAWPWAPAPSPTPASPPSTWARTRSSWASASTASPDTAAVPWRSPTASSPSSTSACAKTWA